MLLALPASDERHVRAILQAARPWHWDLVDVELTRGYIPTDRAPEGAIVGYSPSHPLVGRIRASGCPVVRLGWRPHERDDEVPVVLPDHAAAARLAVEHFADRGFQELAFEASLPWEDERQLYRPFNELAKEAGLRVHLYRFKTSPPVGVDRHSAAAHEQRARLVGEWLTGLSKPIAVFSRSASTLCAIWQQIGLSVPDEVALLGHGNHLLPCELSPVPLSSIDTGRAEQGQQAAELLLRLMQGEAAPRAPIVVPPSGVVARASTDILAVDDPLVARALRYMWDHLDHDLSVDEIARKVDAPRHRLERAFREHLRRGVNAELRRKRIEVLCGLLRSSDAPIADLAPQVGFRTLTHMHNTFRRARGMTPRQYRSERRSRDAS